MSGPLHTVHVRVNDAATGQPTPVRIRFVGPPNGGGEFFFLRQGSRPEGMVAADYYPPFGRLAKLLSYANADLPHQGGNIELNSEPWAYIDGSCEIRLPAHPITVEICKGFEYTPVRREVVLGEGKLALRIAIERWIDLRQEGWFPGDIAVFDYPPHDVLLEGAGEGLAIVNLLATENWCQLEEDQEPWVGSIPNIVAFSGQKPALEMPDCQVVVNTHNNGTHLGSLLLLNCHRVVYPLGIGSCGLRNFYDWTLADWCGQCHRKGGLVLWAAFGSRRKEPTPNDGYGGETLAECVLGKMDGIAVHLAEWMEKPHKHEWYRLLNCGFRVPLAGGSFKISALHNAPGGPRTYARLRNGEEFTYKNWIEAIRAGRTFVSNGPLLTLAVNGQDPGAVIDLPEGTRTVRVRAEARGIVPFERLELVFNGEPLAGTEASGSPCSALLEGDVEIPGSGWLAARCWGTSPAFAAWDPDSQHAAAHTSPVYLQVAGRPFTPDLMSLALLIERIDQMIAWADKEARFDSDKRREELLGIFQTARAELVRRSGKN